MSPISSNKRRRGVLLVEAMVSFFIFLIASIAFYGLMANTRRADMKARQVLAANAYARQLMEGQRIKGYSSLKLGTTKSSKQFLSDRDGVAGATRVDTVVTVYEGPGSGVKSIVVTVSGNQGKISLESYVTQ